MSSGYYPPGAENDPSAPYNQPDDSYIREKAFELAEDDAKINEDIWFEYIVDKFDLENEEDNVKVQTAIDKANDPNIIEEFYEDNDDHYWEMAVEYFSNQEPPEPDYEDY